MTTWGLLYACLVWKILLIFRTLIKGWLRILERISKYFGVVWVELSYVIVGIGRIH